MKSPVNKEIRKSRTDQKVGGSNPLAHVVFGRNLDFSRFLLLFAESWQNKKEKLLVIISRNSVGKRYMIETRKQ